MANSMRDVEPDTEHTRTQFNCLHLSACILHTSATEIESHVLNFKRDAKCHSNRDEEEEEVEEAKKMVVNYTRRRAHSDCIFIAIS